MNNLPNLSEWHEVPRGVTIPNGTRWAMLYYDGDFAVYNYEVDTAEHDETTKFYTAEPIERTLAQVIEDAYNNFGDWESAAQAARDFLAPKETVPPFVIDNDNDKWVLNDKGTYDLPGFRDAFYRGKTLDHIRTHWGIQEENL